MNKIIRIISVCLLTILITQSCDDDDTTAVNTIDPISPATLVFPENNTVCNEGTIISETETDVLFQWEAGSNASSYVLEINNLNDGTTREISTLSTEFLIRILRGTPYSWSVQSFGADGNESADSSVWSFYNAGLPVENHAPFPATAVNPQSGSTVNSGSISLQWQTSDIDNDIDSYTVLFDTSNPPVTILETTSNTNANASVSSGEVYYWRIITTDDVGNSSSSQVFQFGVN